MFSYWRNRLTSWGGTSKETVLRSTHLKWSIQGMTKKIPGPWNKYQVRSTTKIPPGGKMFPQNPLKIGKISTKKGNNNSHEWAGLHCLPWLRPASVCQVWRWPLSHIPEQPEQWTVNTIKAGFSSIKHKELSKSLKKSSALVTQSVRLSPPLCPSTVYVDFCIDLVNKQFWPPWWFIFRLI